MYKRQMELYNELSKEFMVDYDETGSIGKRYRRFDCSNCSSMFL